MSLCSYSHRTICISANFPIFVTRVGGRSARCYSGPFSSARYLSNAFDGSVHHSIHRDTSVNLDGTRARSAPRKSSSPESSATEHRTWRPLYSDGQIGLRKAAWLRMDPVSKWTILVDLARRGPYLLDNGNTARRDTKHWLRRIKDFFARSNKGYTQSSVALRNRDLEEKASEWSVLGESDEQVQFTKASTKHHAFVCDALPYPARLQLALSLLLWLRCLRDVQDTFARLHKPFAHTTRLQNSLLAHVFPTRLMEYSVDWVSCVSVKMCEKLNSTGEQAAPPHTWDPLTAETIEDEASEMTLAVGGARARHGKRFARSTKLLAYVKGLTPRPSADDALAARLLGSGPKRRRLRNQLLARHSGSYLSPSTSHKSVRADVEFRSRVRKPSTPCIDADTDHKLLFSPLEPNPARDACYHDNIERDEGTPLSDHGIVTSCPIHIPKDYNTIFGAYDEKACASNVALETEARLGRCVQAHAAILSSLFIEGRVVQFTTPDPVAYHYVLWLFEELIEAKYIFVELIEKEGNPISSQLLPYYPPWCFRSVLALLPPVTRTIKQSEVVNLAGLIIRAAPCDVLVETISPTQLDDHNQDKKVVNATLSFNKAPTPSYITQVQEEVERQKQKLLKTSSQNDQFYRHRSGETDPWRVSWVRLRAQKPASEKCTIHSQIVHDQEQRNDPADRPKHSFSLTSDDVGTASCKNVQQFRIGMRSLFYPSFLTVTLLKRLLDVCQWWITSGDDQESLRQLQRGEWFIKEVNNVLENRVYALELLYLPHNSALPTRYVRDWIWKRLPYGLRLVGVNTSPWDTLFFFPQVPFLSHKVGNAFRYRAVERTVVSKHASAFGAGFLRSLYGRGVWLRGGKKWERCGLNARLNTLDRAFLLGSTYKSKESQAAHAEALNQDVRVSFEEGSDKAVDVLVTERIIEYLANPSKLTWLGLFSARFFRL